MTDPDFYCPNCRMIRPIEEKIVERCRVRCLKCKEKAEKGKRIAMMRRAEEARKERGQV